MSPLKVTAPFGEDADVMAIVSPSTSLSLDNTFTVTALSSFTDALSLFATGSSFTAITVTVALADAVPPLPSETVYETTAVPLKSGAGVNTTLPSPLVCAVPFVAESAVTVSASLSASLSLSSTSIMTSTSSFVVAVSSTATGSSFTLATFTDIEPVAEPPSPSLITYVIVVGPLKFSVGVNVTLLPEIVAEPLGDDAEVIEIVSPSTSVSLPNTLIVTDSSSCTLPESGLATGTSFIAFTVTFTCALSLPPRPSDTV